MDSSFSLRSYSRQKGAALAGLLANAWVEMRRLQAYAEQFVSVDESSFCPNQVEALCGVLEQACVTIHGRIVYLNGSDRFQLENSRLERPRRENSPRTRALVTTYRSCCRRLCRALSEAKRLGDTITAWLLNDLVMRLEKQLWLLEPAGGNCRVPSLFFNS